ncbi:hypothetical protein C8Q74DRAFT_373656 [Fomes fomentarius]|nr:hypothetical protein C8Q74DRAFT_373656 [Fomes fomentarius]
MPKITTKSQRSARSARQAVDQDIKPDLLEQLAAPGFQSFSRTHRAQLSDLLGQHNLKPTSSFCTNWAAECNVNPVLVDDWLQRRTAGGRRKENAAPVVNGASDRARGRVVGTRRESSVVDINVKRERAESPALLPPPLVRTVKTRRKDTQNKPASAVRHTRAHDKDPHPACPACAQSLSSVPSHSSAPQIAINSGSTSATAGIPAAATVPPYAVSAVLKSALRGSSQSCAPGIRPRQVRFSQDLNEAVDIAYAHSASAQRAYTQPARSEIAQISLSSLPPRLKRKFEAQAAAAANTRGRQDPIAGHIVNLASSGAWPDFPTSEVRSTAREDTVDTLAWLASRSPASSPALPLPDHSHIQPNSEDHAAPESLLPPKRRKVCHASEPAIQSDVSVSLPLSPSPNLPRTPSPTIKLESSSSFFSPSFFSPPARSLSSSPSIFDHESENLPSSSPPTSPFPCPSPPPLASPVPKRVIQSISLMSEPPVVRQDTESTLAAGKPTRIEDSSPAEMALLPPLNLSPNPNRSTSPHPDILPPPEDLPPRPRPRSPPCPGGPGTGSRPSTPQPYRPERPGADVGNGMRESCESVHIEGGQEQVQVEQVSRRVVCVSRKLRLAAQETLRVRDSVDLPASEIPADARARAGVEVRLDGREIVPGDGDGTRMRCVNMDGVPLQTTSTVHRKKTQSSRVAFGSPTTVKTEAQEIKVPEQSAVFVLDDDEDDRE